MNKWTDEQTKAIEAFGSPIIVSAAAGSGKTAVLVERTVRLLTDREKNIPADALLAVTFTNDAAAQMSEKLSAAIDKAAGDDPSNDWLQRQQALLRLAEITTINSFCFGLVKDNLSDTDFSAGVRIIDENESAMLCDRALTDVLENEYAAHPAETEQLMSLFCRENDANLRKMLLRLHSFLRTLPFPERWAKSVIKSLRSGEAGEEIRKFARRRIDDKFSAVKALAERLTSVCGGLVNYSAAKNVLLENIYISRSFIDSSTGCEPWEIIDAAAGIKFRSLTVRQTKAEKLNTSPEEATLYETAKDLNSRMKDVFKELSGSVRFTDKEIADDAEDVATWFEKLYDLVKKLDSAVYEMKVERNALDFADTELMSVKLLVNCDDNGILSRTPLCEEIVNSGRYRVILIDEFQDVNNLQEVIFKAISNTDNLSEIGSNLFAVGDVKQAIYRFRQANPKIFMRTREQGKDPSSPVTELLLRKNFRSRKSVLDFCNYVFGSLMSKEVGETDYTAEETLYQGSDFITPDEPTEIILINTDGEASASDIEFSAASRRIRQMINDGVQVKDGDIFRPCRPSDFCVLTRNNVSGSELSDIFSADGLKVLTTETSGYLSSREISLLLNLLAITVSPMQDVPLASVMLSPILGFTDDEVASLRIISRREKLYKTVLRCSEGDCGTDDLKEKCKSAVALIKRLSVYASELTLTRLIRKIYDLTDIFSLASSYEDAEQKCANLYLLLDYASSYEKSGADGLAGFLRYIDYIKKSGGDFEQALTVTESADAVNVKTVHRSKGLEYPFVILCQTGKRFNMQDLAASMQLSAERGVGLKFLDYDTLTRRPTVFWEYLRSCGLEESLSEELRLLYVAMTRAKERLIIILDASESALKRASAMSYEITGPKISPSLASKAVCTADWLMSALVKHPDFTALRSRLGMPAYTDTGDLPSIKVMPMPEHPDIPESSEEKISIDSNLRDKILRGFEMKIDERLTKSEAKLTVSEIVKDDALSFFPQVPTLDESLEEFSAAKRGTITHRFMQYCDLKSAENDPEAEIKRLKESGVFTEKEAEAIDRRSVSGFFKSGIYSRLRLSKNVLREQRFIVRFDDIKVDPELQKVYQGTEGMLQGVADCLFEEEDGYVLIDYKTDRVKNLSDLLDRYSPQLSLYKAAFDVILDKPVKSAYIYSFRLGEGIECLSF